MASSNLNIAYSSEGIQTEIESFRKNVVDETATKIKDDSSLRTKINEVWVGVDCDKFLEALTTSQEKVCEDMNTYYNDFKTQLESIDTRWQEMQASNNVTGGDA